MPVVPRARNIVDFAAPGTSARIQAPNMGQGGEMVGRALENFGGQLNEAAKTREEIDNQFDMAAAKEAATHLTAYHTEAAYNPETGLYAKRGKDALDASGGFQKSLTDHVAELQKGLKNPRQRHYFEQIATPQMLDWSQTANSFVTKEKLAYSTDQASARATISLKAAASVYPTDPAQGEQQLATAMGEIEHAGRLQGWSDEQIQEKQQDLTSKAFSAGAQQIFVNDPVAAMSFVEKHRERMDPATVANLEESFRPRVQRVQGRALADLLGGQNTAADPLAPLPHGDPESVWSRMVGPGGHGGVEAGTNADGSFRTSPKGAIGPAQVIPGTAPEAARLAGLAYDDHRYKNDFAYNLALGKAYFNKQLSDFGDPILAAAAYNAGPSAVRNALKKGGAEGWTAHLPAETRAYVAKVSGGASASVGSSPRSILAQQLKALDATDAPYEVKEAARSALTQRAQEQSIIAKEEHDQWLNGFMLDLHDGKAGKGDIEAARKTGRLSDYDEISRAENIIEQRQKESADLTNFGQMMGDSHFVFNQYDDTQKKAVEAGVKAMGGTPQAAFQVWQRTGILAKSGSIALRGALVSTNGHAVREAANIAGNMLRVNPNAFAGVEGGSDIEHAAVAFNHYVFDLGLNPDVAAQRVAQENDPKFKEKTKYTDPQRQEAMKQLRQNGGAQAQTVFKDAAFPNPELREEANQTYHEMIVDGLSRGLDLGGAQAQAAAQFRKVYGVNSRGRIVKYAPEAIYPAVGGSHAYIYKDAERTVKQETGRDPVSVNLVPIPGVTDQDFRNGRPARYRLLYSYKSHGQTIVDAVPGQFAADTEGPVKELSTQRRRSFAQERRQAIIQAEQRRRQADPATRPGMQAFR